MHLQKSVDTALIIVLVEGTFKSKVKLFVSDACINRRSFCEGSRARKQWFSSSFLS